MTGHSEHELVVAKQVTWREIAAQWAVLGGLALVVTVGGVAWTGAAHHRVEDRPARLDIVDTETRHMQVAASAHRIEEPALVQLARPRVVSQGFEENDWEARAEERTDSDFGYLNAAFALAAAPVVPSPRTGPAPCL